MNFFSNLFEKQEEVFSDFNWKPLLEMEQLEEVKEVSFNKTIVIFKHSTRCGISRSVLKQFEKKFQIETIDFYYLDLLKFREMSNEIANKFKVTHQSPQLLIFKNGEVIENASHHDLLALDLNQFS